MRRIEGTVLFGKYQICKVLGSGRAGTVFLGIHKELLEYRAIKRVSKSFVDYQRFKQEAMILKNLRHPGIPVVYDLEEDLEYSYLIEEYLEGESFYDLVKNQGHLSMAMTVLYGIQICQIVNYLHSAGKIPILYLDLQPKNLLLCQDTVKLVDFDHAVSITDANQMLKRYGCIGFAAPEQFTSETLDERTDIYAIGVILSFMCQGLKGSNLPASQPSGNLGQLARVIKICTSKDREKRYQSVKEVLAALEAIQNFRTGVFRKIQIPSLNLAVAGIRPGAGVTHLSIGLCAWLRKNGYPSLYEEWNLSGDMKRLQLYFHEQTDRFGLFRVKGVMLKPWYGEAVCLENHGYQIVVRDYGTDFLQAVSSADLDGIILITGGAWWNSDISDMLEQKLIAGKRIFFVYNQVIPGLKIKLPKGVDKKTCFCMPHQENPFISDYKIQSFYRYLLQVVTDKKEGKNRRDYFENVFRRIWLRIQKQ